MIPLLMSGSATVFDSGDALIDAIKCECTMTDMQYELRLDYPTDGAFYSDIEVGKIIAVRPNATDETQAFRVYRIGKTIKGVTTIYANHLSYDLSGIVVAPFTAQNASDFAVKIKSNCTTECPFTFTSDLTLEEELKIEVPNSARALLGGGDKTWQGVYGGEFKFDNYSVSLLRAAGQNRGVVFQYGVDLVDFQQEENIADMYTGIVPYYKNGDSAAVVGSVLYAQGTFDRQRIQAVDVSEYIAEDNPSVAKVNEIGQRWLEDNEIGKPVVSLTIQFAQLDQVVCLHDTVGVQFIKLGVAVNAQVVKTVYDCLRERNISIDVGDVRASLNDNVHDASKLKKGLLPAERIKNGSIGGGKLGGGAVKSKNIEDNAVTVNKIANGSVSSSKIADGAVTGNKILDQAIAFAKLTTEMQVTWTNILAAQAVFASFVYSSGILQSVNGIVVGSTLFQGRWIGSALPSGGVENVYVLGAAQ